MKRALRIRGNAELAHMHAVDSMFRQRFVYIGWHGAEVFTDYLDLVPVGFQTQDRIELIKRVVNINGFAGSKAARDPK